METFIDINEYKYNLPNEKIALHPLPERDQSKLLVFKNGLIEHATFSELDTHLPNDATLFFNNTKVIPARLIFKKETGAEIEIFLLNPLLPSSIISLAMEAKSTAQWHVSIGNAKRWNIGKLQLHLDECVLEAELTDRENSIVTFNWQPINLSSEVISRIGKTPLPPYLKRELVLSDKERYQTVYSEKEGAVAAPTAGLHFTEQVLTSLRKKNITTDFLTLHVSAGTFQPVKVENAVEHVMHSEQIVVTRNNIENLINLKGKLIAVGTTSLRTLESLYWYGVKLQYDSKADFRIDQNFPYQKSVQNISREESFRTILAKMKKEEINHLIGQTSIYIMPGYAIKTADALITNFHQPGSTLLLLISAFVGSDWKNIYSTALENNYRFLSFGDSSLLWRKG